MKAMMFIDKMLSHYSVAFMNSVKCVQLFGIMLLMLTM